jgi:hypothetical protein
MVLRNSDIAIVGGRFARSGPTFATSITGFSTEDPSSFDLPAGIYDLYVLGREEPVSLTIRLRGLEGVTRLEATAPTDARIRSGSIEPQTSPGGFSYSFGGAGRVHRGNGVIFSALWYRPKAGSASRWDSCFFTGTPPPPEATLPACSTINGLTFGALSGRTLKSRGSSGSNLETNASRLYSLGWLPRVESGVRDNRYGQQTSLEAVTLPARAYALSLWLSF